MSTHTCCTAKRVVPTIGIGRSALLRMTACVRASGKHRVGGAEPSLRCREQPALYMNTNATTSLQLLLSTLVAELPDVQKGRYGCHVNMEGVSSLTQPACGGSPWDLLPLLPPWPKWQTCSCSSSVTFTRPQPLPQAWTEHCCVLSASIQNQAKGMYGCAVKRLQVQVSPSQPVLLTIGSAAAAATLATIASGM